MQRWIVVLALGVFILSELGTLSYLIGPIGPTSADGSQPSPRKPPSGVPSLRDRARQANDSRPTDLLVEN